MGDDDRVGGGPIANIVSRGVVREEQEKGGIVLTVLDGVTVTACEGDVEVRDSLAGFLKGVRRMNFCTDNEHTTAGPALHDRRRAVCSPRKLGVRGESGELTGGHGGDG